MSFPASEHRKVRSFWWRIVWDFELLSALWLVLANVFPPVESSNLFILPKVRWRDKFWRYGEKGTAETRNYKNRRRGTVLHFRREVTELRERSRNKSTEHYISTENRQIVILYQQRREIMFNKFNMWEKIHASSVYLCLEIFPSLKRLLTRFWHNSSSRCNILASTVNVRTSR